MLAGLILAVMSPFIANKLFPVGDGMSAAIAGGAIVAAGTLALKVSGAAGAAASGAAGASGASRVDQLVQPSTPSSGGGG